MCLCVYTHMHTHFLCIYEYIESKVKALDLLNYSGIKTPSTTSTKNPQKTNKQKRPPQTNQTYKKHLNKQPPPIKMMG